MTEREQQFIDAWKRAGPVLEQRRHAELQRLTSAEGTRLATFLGVIVKTQPKPTSGLLEFQSWMKRWRSG